MFTAAFMANIRENLCTFDPPTILAFTATCKTMERDRWELMANHSSILSCIVNAAIKSDFSIKALLEKLQKNVYQTEISLEVSDKTVGRIKKLIGRFSKVTTLTFGSGLSELQCRETLMLFPSIQHVYGQFPSELKVALPFPKTLQSMCLKSTKEEYRKSPLTDEYVEQLLTDCCEGLKALHLAGWQKRALTFETISIPKTITKLTLSYTNIGDADFLKFMTTCSQLEWLEMRGSRITASCFGKVKFQSWLRHIDLEGTSIAIDGLANIASSCRGIEFLSLSCCRGFESEQLCSISFSTTLRYLHLNCSIISRSLLQYITKAFPQLKGLSFGSCRIMPELFEEEDFPATLESLDLRNSEIRDKGVKRLRLTCPHLKHLVLDGCLNLRSLPLSD